MERGCDGCRAAVEVVVMKMEGGRNGEIARDGSFVGSSNLFVRTHWRSSAHASMIGLCSLHRSETYVSTSLERVGGV